MDRIRSRRIVSLTVWTIVLTTALILSRQGLIPSWIFYTLLIALHVWIFSKIIRSIYYLKKKYRP